MVVKLESRRHAVKQSSHFGAAARQRRWTVNDDPMLRKTQGVLYGTFLGVWVLLLTGQVLLIGRIRDVFPETTRPPEWMKLAVYLHA
jgi:hypothetical protein